MRVYIIGNDGITLCREAPTTVNDGEIAVASNEELHAAPLSGRRLLALWNALPGVEKRKKVGDRDALIDQRIAVANFVSLLDAGQSVPQCQQPLAAERGSVQLLVRCNGNLAVIDCRRRLAAQRDPVVADNVNAHEWVLLTDPAAVPP